MITVERLIELEGQAICYGWNDLRECIDEIKRLRFALARIKDIDQDYDTQKVGHYLLKKQCKIIAKEALGKI